MNPSRKIRFGKGRHLGTLYHRPPSGTWGGGSEWWPWESSQEVHGPVTVPKGHQIRLWASQKAANRWERVPGRFEGLRRLAANDLDSLAVLSPAPGWAPHIARLTGLSELIAGEWGLLSDREFRSLLSLQRLVSLDVGYSSISSPRLVAMIQANRRLRFLDAGGCKIGDEVVAALARRPGLRRLNLQASGLDDSGLARLAALQQLEYLSLSECGITDASSTVLGQLGQLEELRLDKTGVGDETIGALRSPSLRTLFLSDTAVTGETLDPDTLQDLETLLGFSSSITDAGLHRVAQLPNLRNLYVMGTEIGDEGLAALNGHPTLELISLSFSLVTPGAILDLIESVPTLHSIWHGMDSYKTPERIAEFAGELRKLPRDAKPVPLEDLEPVEGKAERLEGTWKDLGPIVGEEPDIKRFAYDGHGRLWVGVPNETPGGRPRQVPEWQSADWWPKDSGPFVLDGASGFLELDDAGRLWIGDHDLWSFDGLPGKVPHREQSWRFGYFNSIAFDHEQRPWVTRNADEVWRLTRTGWEQVELPDAPSCVGLDDIACAADGSVWIASSEGLYRWKQGTWEHWQGPSDGLPEEYGFDAWAPSETTRMVGLAVATDGALWACGGTGVVRYQDGTFTKWDHRDGVWPWWQLLADPDTGAIYGVSGGHIGRFFRGEWTVCSVPDEYIAGPLSGIRFALFREGALELLTVEGQLLRFEPGW